MPSDPGCIEQYGEPPKTVLRAREGARGHKQDVARLSSHMRKHINTPGPLRFHGSGPRRTPCGPGRGEGDMRRGPTPIRHSGRKVGTMSASGPRS